MKTKAAATQVPKEVMDALRTQVADLTREYDAIIEGQQAYLATVLARAEKAERQITAIQTVLSPLTLGGTTNADVADVVNSLVANRNGVIATLASRDAALAEERKKRAGAEHAISDLVATQQRMESTIAEARALAERLIRWRTVLDTKRESIDDIIPDVRAWLAEQPGVATKPKPAYIAQRDLDAVRAEVARQGALLARCEAWIEWQLSTKCATPGAGTALLADLRAGRATHG